MITQEQIISSGSWIWSSGAGNTLPRLEQPAGLLRKTLYPRREAAGSGIQKVHRHSVVRRTPPRLRRNPDALRQHQSLMEAER